jgi:hypothetical protein
LLEEAVGAAMAMEARREMERSLERYMVGFRACPVGT